MSNKRYPHLMFSEKIVSLHSKARSFDIMQNKAEYRTSLVSKSLPIAKRLSAIYSFPIAKTIRCVSNNGQDARFQILLREEDYIVLRRFTSLPTKGSFTTNSFSSLRISTSVPYRAYCRCRFFNPAPLLAT